ncbi:merozoite surface protein 4 [Plasmodium sp. gorilla clade G2]|uniref:merozoite surface protein 4 n=1 Tax=Plasmodium sp. gorilla clade G2 TaxID=880535 RepID=UPI000D226F2C|nr:merozoite surface protein 4 [Plasmodium sp. gorilla clade G2]SOV10524.1 merozoite surface protein 4 [Plasmodium sp. gorilla clade G2]
MWIVKFLIVVNFFLSCTTHFDKLYSSYSYNIVPENGSMLNRRILEEDKRNVKVGSTSDASGKDGSSSGSPNSSSTEGKENENTTTEQAGKGSNKEESAKETANEKGGAKVEEKDKEQTVGEKAGKDQKKVTEESGKESKVAVDTKKNEAIPEKVAEPRSPTSDEHAGEEEDEDEDDEEEEEDDDEDSDSSSYDTYNKEDSDDEDLCKHNNGDCGDDKICEYVGNRRVKCKCKEGYKLEGIECVEMFSLASSSLNLIFNSFITIFVVILLIN